jgi:hypothetical protein
MTPARFRTIKSRCRVPVEPQRGKKSAEVFDQDVARETQRRNCLILRRSLRGTGPDGPLEFFWVEKGDRSTHLSPLRQPKREHNEFRPQPTISIVTRAVLDAEARYVKRTPFAEHHASLA